MYSIALKVQLSLMCNKTSVAKYRIKLIAQISHVILQCSSKMYHLPFQRHFATYASFSAVHQTQFGSDVE